LLCVGYAAGGLEIWRNPEGAEAGRLFVDARFLTAGFDGSFAAVLPELGADWLLPVPLPLSAGVFMATPDPNLKSFGLRAGWHIDLFDERTDLYVFYVMDLGFVRNALLEEYGDTPAEAKWYDFRVGVRRLMGRFCLTIESAYKFAGIRAGISIAL